MSTDPLAEDVEALARVILAERLAARELPNSYLSDAELLDAMRPRAEHILASDWLAAHDAQVRADERQKVAALLADKGAVEKVARHVYDEAGFHAADSWNTEGSIMREHYRRDARAAIDVIAGLIGGEA